MLPADLQRALSPHMGDVRIAQPVSGGDINAAWRIETTSGQRHFIKWNPQPQPHLFEVEARGLHLLATAQALRVPRVITVIDQPPALVLEWIEPGVNKSAAAEDLGRGLAQQHRSIGAAYGLDHDNYLGATPQINTPTESWLEFFRDRRLGEQAKVAQARGHLPPDRARRLDRVLANLDRWIDPAVVTPSLLHGDLWGGNYLIDTIGQPVLIDPAVYYGDREAEIAFTELFGGFGARFYAAYNEAWPVDRGYADRRDLYNLYHLLNHLNLFGEGYGGAVDAIVRRYGD
ncbi:MAG: fructosamine kinase family protein [Chloroflexi bacterium]|nr:fructosamine kinase family protein [Chloroflexota bacterium]